MLDYVVTSNHIHLLVFDNGGRNVIPDSIRLVAGRTGQEFNIRKNRKGAFLEDRYHATAVESNRYLRECITYIDMNMVRTGVVKHPSEWECCGYNEIQNPRKRKRIIDFERLMELLGFENYTDLKESHFKWIDRALEIDSGGSESKWTRSIAVGSKPFIVKIKDTLGFKAQGRKVTGSADIFELREKQSPFGEAERSNSGNAFIWE